MLCTTKRLVKAPWRRAYAARRSPVNPYPFHNLRAYPFNISPHKAQCLLSPFASLFVRNRYLESSLCWLFPNLGFSPIRPVRLQPVYFPGWILDVELQGQVEIKGNNRQASAQIHYAYIPGSDYKVLSAAAVAPMHPDLAKSVPFSEDLLRQHDVDIACIPYNISPFSVLDIAGHLSYAEATIEPNFRLIPSTLKANLFAAYPILLPLYLAQYEVKTKSGTRLHTLFIEAYDTLANNVWSESLADFALQNTMFRGVHSSLGLPAQSNPAVFNLVYHNRFVDTARFSLAPHKTLGKSLCKYIEDAINLPGAATTLAAASVQDLDQLAKDRRIREFTPKERNPVVEWLKLGSEIAMVERMHEALSQAGNVTVKDPGVKQQNQPFIDKTINSLLDKFQTLQADRLKIKPDWAKTQEEQERKSPGEA